MLIQATNSICFISIIINISCQTGRPVPIILPKETVNGLQYLTDPEIRKSAGVSPSNNYVFASQGRILYLSGNFCFGQYSKRTLE